VKSLQHYEQPSFSDGENVFLHHYAETSNRIDAMVYAGLAPAPPSTPDEHAAIALAAANIISKAELMPISAIASALGGDKILVLAEVWRLARQAEPRDAIKALNLLARIHGMLTDKSSSKSVNLILNPPTPPPSTLTGLPFTLEVKS